MILPADWRSKVNQEADTREFLIWVGLPFVQHCSRLEKIRKITHCLLF